MTYQNMPARQLRKVAPQIGLTGASRKTKDEIVSWIDQNVGALTPEQRGLVGLDEAPIDVARERKRPRGVLSDITARARRQGATPDVAILDETTSAERRAGSMTRGERDALRRTPRAVYDPAAHLSAAEQRVAGSRWQRRHRTGTAWNDATQRTALVMKMTRAERRAAQRRTQARMQPAVWAIELGTGRAVLAPRSSLLHAPGVSGSSARFVKAGVAL